jgi:hypothetical protein
MVAAAAALVIAVLVLAMGGCGGVPHPQPVQLTGFENYGNKPTKIQDFSSCSFCLSSFSLHFRYLK